MNKLEIKQLRKLTAALDSARDIVRSLLPSRSPLEAFIEDECFEVPGETMLFTDFYDRFIATLSGSQRLEWHHKQKVIRSLPARFPYGSRAHNRRYIGNISWEDIESSAPRLILKGHKLVAS